MLAIAILDQARTNFSVNELILKNQQELTQILIYVIKKLITLKIMYK